MDMLFFLLVDFGIWGVGGWGLCVDWFSFSFYYIPLHHTLCYLAVTRSLLANRCLVTVQDNKNLRIAATYIYS